MRFPNFSLTADDGTVQRRADYRGRPFVVYFYPKDNTPGCSLESQAFRDAAPALTKLGVAVLGVSMDSQASHCRFKAKYDLTFPLLVDDQHELSAALGVWGEKKLYGRTFMGLVRSTFLVDSTGEIVREWRKVKVAGHVDEVLAAARDLVRAAKP